MSREGELRKERAKEVRCEIEGTKRDRDRKPGKSHHDRVDIALLLMRRTARKLGNENVYRNEGADCNKNEIGNAKRREVYVELGSRSKDMREQAIAQKR